MSLPRMMQAIVCHGPEDYRLEEWKVPQAGPEEVVIQVKLAGICASDLKCYLGAPLFWGDKGFCQPPVIPGHEFVGEVVALGPGAGEKYGLQIGDMAISEQIVPCHECRFCKNGQYWMCQFGDVYGFRQNTFGAMAEYMVFPRKALNYKVPATMPLEQAVLIEPLACSIHAVDRGDIKQTDVVVVAGCGPLGLGMVAAARLKKPATLIALDLLDHRLDVAKACGADLCLNPNKVDVVAEILKLTDGYGCDVYIEATGQPSGVTQGLQMIRKLGTFVEFSVMRDMVTADWTIIGDKKELNLLGAHLGPYCYPRAIDMLQKGQIPADRIVTHQAPLATFNDSMALVKSAQKSIKVALKP
jgi:2-desacetyl-2-hydroxyethyl bacteriochlorophyllide A dehydrogenase